MVSDFPEFECEEINAAIGAHSPVWGFIYGVTRGQWLTCVCCRSEGVLFHSTNCATGVLPKARSLNGGSQTTPSPTRPCSMFLYPPGGYKKFGTRVSFHTADCKNCVTSISTKPLPSVLSFVSGRHHPPGGYKNIQLQVRWSDGGNRLRMKEHWEEVSC